MKTQMIKFVLWAKALLGIRKSLYDNPVLTAVEVTEKLKQIVRSKLVAKAVDLIPGVKDNEALEFLDAHIIPALMQVARYHDLLKSTTRKHEAWTTILKGLRNLSDHEEANYYIDFAGRLNMRLSDGKFSFKEAKDSAQELWKRVFKK
jgi:hypothetical protein